MDSMCPCKGLDGLELVQCLAPPPSDYEATLRLPSGDLLVVNSEGFHLRSIALDDTLPFLTTRDRLLDKNRAQQLLAGTGLGLRDLLCTVYTSLVQAARNGSKPAQEKLEACKSIIEGLECRS